MVKPGPQERQILERFNPEPNAVSRGVASLVAFLSRLLMRRGNQLEVLQAEHLNWALSQDRGLLSFSNHVSLFDDPWLTACLSQPSWKNLRWIAADAQNFFGTPFKAMIFNTGKCVPVFRGLGSDQPGMSFLADRLAVGEWVHIFPEGGRTRDPKAGLRLPLKNGMAQLIQASEPLLLPFYHQGMDSVLPVGARIPRLGQNVRVIVGEVLDGSAGLAHQSQEEIMTRVEQLLLKLERQLSLA